MLNQIKESHHLKTIENYYEIYQKIFSISIGLLSMFNNYNKNDNNNSEVSEFIEENFAYDFAIDELANRIMQTEIKNDNIFQMTRFNHTMIFFKLTD